MPVLRCSAARGDESYRRSEATRKRQQATGNFTRGRGKISPETRGRVAQRAAASDRCAPTGVRSRRPDLTQRRKVRNAARRFFVGGGFAYFAPLRGIGSAGFDDRMARPKPRQNDFDNTPPKPETKSTIGNRKSEFPGSRPRLHSAPITDTLGLPRTTCLGELRLSAERMPAIDPRT